MDVNTREYLNDIQESRTSIMPNPRGKKKASKMIDPKIAEAFLTHGDDSSNAPMIEQMFKNLGHLAPDHNIFNYYKNLAKIEQQRKRWLKQHPPASLHYKRKKPNYIVIQQKKLQTRRSLNPLPWTMDLGKTRSQYRQEEMMGQRTSSFLEVHYGGKNIPRPWHKYKDVVAHRRIIAREQDDFIDFEFTTKERSINTPMTAVLFLHILEIKNVSGNAPTLLSSLPICFYCVVSVGHVKKSSKIALGRKMKKAKLDFSIHFSLEISATRNHFSNNLKIEVWCFQDPETQYVIGIMESHLYEIIKDIHGFKSHPMWVDGIKTGILSFEFAFSYGTLGYGHSNQIRNTAVELYDILGNSMFPRVTLSSKKDEEVVRTAFETRIPSKLKLMDVDSLLQEVIRVPPQFINGTYLEGGTRALPIPMKLEKVHFEEGLPTYCLVHNKIYQKSIQADFNDVYGEYIVLRHRKDRLAYLHDLLNGPQNDIEETDIATYLFQELHLHDFEHILDTDEDSVRHGVSYIHPRQIKCDERDPIVLTKEDELFMDQFPSVPRQSGYLAVLFGYSPLPNPEDFLNDMDYPLVVTVIEKSRWKRMKKWYSICNYRPSDIKLYFKNLWKFILKWWEHFFPNVANREAEISVTTPSAPGSVTKVYSYFVNEDKDRNLTEVMRLVQKTTALLALEEVDEETKKEADDTKKGIPHLNPREQPLDNKESPYCKLPVKPEAEELPSFSRTLLNKLKTAGKTKIAEDDAKTADP